MAWQRTRTALALALTGILAACSSTSDVSGTAPGVAATGPLAQAFDASAASASVPRDLLVAIAQVEGGLDMPAERLDLEADAAVPAAGPLMLRHGKLDTLARGAELVGATELELRQRSDLALEAGAQVLAELGRETSATAGDLASWAEAVEQMSGYADDAHREHYVHRVFATLARGGRFEGRDGEVIVLPAHDLPPTLTLDVSYKLRALSKQSEYPGAEWIPTSCDDKCTRTRDGASVQFIVIHDTEGGWDASVATLQNDPGKSVQYIVGKDGRVAQFVTESTTAWHAGNYYYNQRSVGIEHVGYSTKPYPEAEYAASAKLVDYLADKYGVERDRAHIIGHDQVPDGTVIGQSAKPCSASPKSCESSSKYGGAANHGDPGIWEWAVYMQRIAGVAKCNDVTELWNCSKDKAHAFRCVDDDVEVATCGDGCDVMPNGTDDVCHVAPASTAPTQPGTEPPETTGAEVSLEATADADGFDASGDASAGCAMSSGSTHTPLSGGALAAMGLALTALARRRRNTRL